VVVGTPGRLEEHLRKGSLNLERLEVLVLDEADRMLEMGFAPQIEAVVAYAPRERQTLLFSATIPSSIGELSRGYQQNPRRITVASSGNRGIRAGERVREPEAEVAPAGEVSLATPATRFEQHFYRVPAAQRSAALVRWLGLVRPSTTLVFCNTRAECDELSGELGRLGWVAAAIHGEMAQRQRAHVMRLFANESCSVLAATDVAARGWDIGGLGAVVNLGLSRDTSVHLHRVGRTGRSGQPGLVAHFVADEDLGPLSAIERAHGFQAAFEPLPVAETPLAAPPAPRMVTLRLSAGKNKKLRPGDILGALTAAGGVTGSDVGAIQIEEDHAYVAVAAGAAGQALEHLQKATIKGRLIKARRAELGTP
jgi:ATP-dependent RNA helicase DbpA